MAAAAADRVKSITRRGRLQRGVQAIVLHSQPGGGRRIDVPTRAGVGPS